MLVQYKDLLANVRYDGQFHSIRSLVQPDDPTVRELAQILHQAPDFVAAAQDFVDSFTTYRQEVGDYWTIPAELIEAEAGDCDDKAILLLSILRNYIPADRVFAAFGHLRNGKDTGHMWIETDGVNMPEVIEATTHSRRQIKGDYNVLAIFNDQYVFASPQAIKDFDLKPVQQGNGHLKEILSYG